VAHALKVLAVGTDAPRAPLDKKRISQEISRYWRVSVVEVTGSTQDDLYQLASSGKALPKTILASEYQSSGRGRLDRTFEAAPHSALTFSIYIEPKVDKEEWPFLTLLAGLCVHEALHTLDPQVSVGIKWPNDLLIGDKKFVGMIAQATDKGVVLGIGINVGMTKEELPVENATSLAIEDFEVLDRNLILASIINHFEINLEMWENDQSFLAQYRSASVTLGKEVEVTLPGGEKLSSRAVDISNAGALMLEDGREVTVGDVVHLR
jgi:BirA family transcriptional regulator, biotin operon repressor / biotin---[acetyl-CoA-carboxylase] ligase